MSRYLFEPADLACNASEGIFRVMDALTLSLYWKNSFNKKVFIN